MENRFLYNVIFSQQSETNLDAVVQYLTAEWGETVKNNFINETKRVVELISANPFMFQEYSDSKRIRRCYITKHNAMYYRIVDSTVEIITIHDTRQHPKSLPI